MEIRYQLTPVKRGRYILPEIEKRKWVYEPEHKTFIADNGQLATDIDASCFFATKGQAQKARELLIKSWLTT